MPINRMPTRDFINVKQRNRLDSLITDVTPNSPPEDIAKVREIIKKEIDKNPNDFDPSDIERFMTSDWTVTRFLLRKKEKVEDAAQMIIECGKWRHQLGMPRWKDEDFPQEFYNLGGVFPYTEDLLGNTVIYVRAKLYDKKLTSIQELFRRFMIHVSNRVDNERDGRGWAMVIDCSGTGMSNMDVGMLSFMLNEVIPHLPKGLNYTLIHELPWLLSKIVDGTIACLPSEYKKLAKTSSRKDIHNWVAKENLPDFMGGTCDVNFRRAPKNAKTLEEMKDELKLTDKDVALIKKTYQPYLDEADAALALRKRNKNMRRRSSVMDFWYYLKNKIDTTMGADGSSNNDDQNDANAPAGVSGGKQVKQNISVSKKDGKLAAIADEEN